MTQQNNLNLPWTLHFNRDGVEDIATIRDANGEELVCSPFFWLPESGDTMPPVLVAMQMMVAAPKMLAALESVIRIAALRDTNVQRPEGLFELLRDAAGTASAAIAEATGRAV